MDFFDAQQRARKKTLLLVALFALAVAALIVATNVLLAIVATFTTSVGVANGAQGVFTETSPNQWLAISAIVLLVIGCASVYKYAVLRSGGRAVADLMNGRQIDPATTVLAERKLLNVVEEMAIAAGIPVPPVYLLDEGGINAFAAGLGTADAVIGVTRGTLENLDREELQGVVGHEFSHILNGDSRINLRLIAILHGILFLGLLGELLLRGAGRSRERGAIAFVLLGAGLVAIGYAGTFFGNLIKAAVNRQREFLADAASVQFTRNPIGLADALKKIGANPLGSRLAAARTKEVSHIFFGQAVKLSLGGFFATHPPLEKRIRAIEPGWDGRFVAAHGEPSRASPLPLRSAVSESALVSGFAGAAATPAASAAGSAAAGALPIDHDAIVAQVGNADRRSLSAASARLNDLPAELMAAAHEPLAARALALALFLSDDSAVRARQLDGLAAAEGEALAKRIASLSTALVPLDEVQRATLVSLASPALRTTSAEQYKQLVASMLMLVRADACIDLNEWVMHRLLLHHLSGAFGARAPTKIRRLSTGEEDAALTTVLSSLARVAGPGACERAFRAGADAAARPLSFDAEDDPNFGRLNEALRALREAPPLKKPRYIKACAACVLSAGATPNERALLAGIAATLGCPLPADFRIGPEGPDAGHEIDTE